MKLGIIARCEDRGLGNQTHEACRHLNPDRVLLINPGRDGRFVQHPERYAEFDTMTLRWQPGFTLDEDAVRRWLDGLDVIYSAETPYDDRLPWWALDYGARVVIHANPEQLSPERARRLQHARWWCPTPWRLSELPAGTRVVSMPVAERDTQRELTDRPRFLHVAGWPTAGDRNGTKVVVEAVKHVRSDCDVIIRGQHEDIRRIRSIDGTARLILESGNVPNYWDLYRNADILLLPRRYGGLCLPAQEAMQAGLSIIMPDCSPNEVWPGLRLPTSVRSFVRTSGGHIPLHDVNPHELAALIDELATDADRVDKLQREATEWASANTWAALKPLWLDELERCQ